MAHTTFESWPFYHDMPNDHFNLAEITEGPHSGHRGFGISTNKAKIAKACRIGLVVHALTQGLVGLPFDGDAELASLIQPSEHDRKDVATPHPDAMDNKDDEAAHKPSVSSSSGVAAVQAQVPPWQQKCARSPYREARSESPMRLDVDLLVTAQCGHRNLAAGKFRS